MELTKLSATSQGKLEEALQLYDRALAIDEKVLGPDHPDVAGDLNNKALLLSDMVSCGRFVRAVEVVELTKLVYRAGQVRGGVTALQTQPCHQREGSWSRSSGCRTIAQ